MARGDGDPSGTLGDNGTGQSRQERRHSTQWRPNELRVTGSFGQSHFFVSDLYAMEMNQMVIGGDTTRSAFEGKSEFYGKIVCVFVCSRNQY